MIHLDTERGQGEILRDVLHLMANHPDTEACVRAILQLIQKLTAADGVDFFLFNEPQLHFSVGQGTSIPQNTLRKLVASLHPEIQVNPELPQGVNAGSPCWIAAAIPLESNAVGLLWTACAKRPSEETLSLVNSCLDGLKIISSNAVLKHRQENARRFMDSLLNSISDPFLVLDDDKQLLLMNPAAEAVFETTSADANGKTLRDVVNSDDLAAFAEGNNDRLDEWMINDKTFVPRVQVVHDAAGQPDGWILALRDVTPFKKLNRNQAEFVRIIAHDLRSPLTAMQGFASMMGMVGEVNEKQAHFVERILSGIAQMTSLVENIQDAGRYDPENGFYEMSRSQCDLIEMVDRIVSNHLVPAEKQELSISVVTGDDVPIINVDSHMLERAITNLLDNAIKYTPNGSKIEVGVRRDKDSVVVSVKDSGYGISPDHQKHLFERHVRIARQEHKKVKGSGLGLFIVRSVARRHGGDAWVESVEGSGSTFNIGIPLKGSNLVGSSD
jgi:signal transduction histidine kinase